MASIVTVCERFAHGGMPSAPLDHSHDSHQFNMTLRRTSGSHEPRTDLSRPLAPA